MNENKPQSIYLVLGGTIEEIILTMSIVSNIIFH
jgi:hypothetical protein